MRVPATTTLPSKYSDRRRVWPIRALPESVVILPGPSLPFSRARDRAAAIVSQGLYYARTNGECTICDRRYGELPAACPRSGVAPTGAARLTRQHIWPVSCDWEPLGPPPGLDPWMEHAAWTARTAQSMLNAGWKQVGTMPAAWSGRLAEVAGASPSTVLLNVDLPANLVLLCDECRTSKSDPLANDSDFIGGRWDPEDSAYLAKLAPSWDARMQSLNAHLARRVKNEDGSRYCAQVPLSEVSQVDCATFVRLIQVCEAMLSVAEVLRYCDSTEAIRAIPFGIFSGNPSEARMLKLASRAALHFDLYRTLTTRAENILQTVHAPVSADLVVRPLLADFRDRLQIHAVIENVCDTISLFATEEAVFTNPKRRFDRDTWRGDDSEYWKGLLHLVIDVVRKSNWNQVHPRDRNGRTLTASEVADLLGPEQTIQDGVDRLMREIFSSWGFKLAWGCARLRPSRKPGGIRQWLMLQIAKEALKSSCETVDRLFGEQSPVVAAAREITLNP